MHEILNQMIMRNDTKLRIKENIEYNTLLNSESVKIYPRRSIKSKIIYKQDANKYKNDFLNTRIQKIINETEGLIN